MFIILLGWCQENSPKILNQTNKAVSLLHLVQLYTQMLSSPYLIWKEKKKEYFEFHLYNIKWAPGLSGAIAQATFRKFFKDIGGLAKSGQTSDLLL